MPPEGLLGVVLELAVFLIQASTVLVAIVCGAAVVKERVVFVPGRFWMLSCRSVIVVCGRASLALRGVVVCAEVVVFSAPRALMPMSCNVLGFLVACCVTLVAGAVRLLGAVGGVWFVVGWWCW